MPPKSIFRQPGAKHFQLVHRSLRDPLIHDPEASKHVLKEFERGNDRKGKSRVDLEAVLPADRANVGEAAAYGIYFDDTDYDYMQHLRPVGVKEDGVDSVLLEAPSSSKAKIKSKPQESITLVDLPAESLPSSHEVPRTYESQEAVPSSIAGFQPDMDPHLRQVLEALEDDEFVDEDLADDFFGELVAHGERGADDDADFEFREEGLSDLTREGSEPSDADQGGGEDDWEARFARFKVSQQGLNQPDLSDVDESSEDGDTVGTLPQFSVLGGKKRRKGTSDASGYSMSSSSMFRNEGLTTLDERFDQIQREYDSGSDEQDDSDEDSAPDLITTREDFDEIMNEFLDNYEIVGGKMRPILDGATAVDKLATVRNALGPANIRDQDDDDTDDLLLPVDIDGPKDRWDCETILTTHTNLENHPRLIRIHQTTASPKIRLDPKNGLPTTTEDPPNRSKLSKKVLQRHDAPVTGDSDLSSRTTISRPKDESKEDKRARKLAVKQERQVRRADKKSNKERFSAEIQQQTKRLSDKEKTKMRKL